MTPQLRRIEGIALNSLACACIDLGQFEEALACVQQALSIAREIGHHQLEGTCLSCVANVYSNVGRYSEAIDALKTSLVLVRETIREASDPTVARQFRAHEGKALCNMGNAYWATGNDSEASRCYMDAYEIAVEVAGVRGQSSSVATGWAI